MLRKLLPVLVIFMALGATSFTPALAQSSFGRTEQQVPRTEAEWQSQAERKISSATRRANSAFHLAGKSRTSAVAMIEIVRDGRVTNVRVMKSTGREALDAAILRSYSQIGSVALFSPDMPGNSVVITIDLGTRAG